MDRKIVDSPRPSGFIPKEFAVEHMEQDPKECELCLKKAKSGETLMEACSDTDVQILVPSEVSLRIAGTAFCYFLPVEILISRLGGVTPSADSQTLNGSGFLVGHFWVLVHRDSWTVAMEVGIS
eukprot:gene4050-4696_t